MKVGDCGKGGGRASGRSWMSNLRIGRRPLLGVILAGAALAFALPASAGLVSRSAETQHGKAVQAEPFEASALALSPTSFSDPPGDAGDAMDVTSLELSNDFAGTILFQLVIVEQTTIAAEDRLFVVMDTDRNPATGDTSREGAEYYIDLDGDGFSGAALITLYRWNGAAWASVASPSLRSNNTPTTSGGLSLTIAVDRGDLGGTTGFRFYVTAIYPDGNPVDTEHAPDIGTWTYMLALDTEAPTAVALRSTPISELQNRLSYKITDNSGQARQLLRIYPTGSSSPAWTYTFPLQATANAPGAEQHLDWDVPASIRGLHRFCIQGQDAAGWLSAESCAPIVFLRIKSDAKFKRQQFSWGVRVLRLWLRNLPRGTLVTVDCKKRCARHERATRSGSFTSRKFKNINLRRGTVIEIRATKARWIGHYEKLTVVGGKVGVRECKRTLAPGMRKPARPCR